MVVVVRDPSGEHGPMAPTAAIDGTTARVTRWTAPSKPRSSAAACSGAMFGVRRCQRRPCA
jgi:hypothetical protein